jgi:hypothetical protein
VRIVFDDLEDLINPLTEKIFEPIGFLCELCGKYYAQRLVRRESK